jgi:hypothetical protein
MTDFPQKVDPWHGRILWLFSGLGVAGLFLAIFAYTGAINAASPLRAVMYWPALAVGVAAALRYGTLAVAEWLAVAFGRGEAGGIFTR